MKKDLDKLFSRSIETYYFLLLIVVIIKVLGGNYFEIVYTNRTINMINNFITYWRLENIWYGITLYIYSIVIIGVTTNDCSKKLKKYCLCCLPFFMLMQFLKTNINLPVLFVIFDFVYLLFFSYLYCRINKISFEKINITNYIIIVILTNVLQIFSMLIRNVPIQKQDLFYKSFFIGIILNLDYFITMIILYKYYFVKGGKSLWDLVVSSGSQKLISLRDSLKDLLKKFHDRKPKSKEEKITNAIYIPLYLLWNLFTMLIIIAIAFLNDAFIEAIFITIAFWLNKFSFGKPFHFKSVAVCFGFSSITYYVLTRVTFKTETSFFIPIFLGVALSYVTAHFIKKNTKLYKGMTEELLYETVIQVEQDTLVIKMLKEYYCDRLDDRIIANRNNYSVPSVRLKRQMVNKALKKL